MRRVLYVLWHVLLFALGWFMYSTFNIGWRMGAIIGGLALLGVCLGKWLAWARESGR